MKTAAALKDLGSSAQQAKRPDAEDSQVRLRAPLPPASADREETEWPEEEEAPDFVEFLCGRFELDQERGLTLLATLLQNYVPQEPYPIHTLEPQRAKGAAAVGE